MNGWKMQGENLLVKESPPITQLGSIHLSAEAARNDPTGTVIAAGPESVDRFPVGSAVMFTPSGGFPTFIGTEEYLVLLPKHIVATRETLDAVTLDQSAS